LKNRKKGVDIKTYILSLYLLLKNQMPEITKKYAEIVLDETLANINGRASWGNSEHPISENLGLIHTAETSYVVSGSPHAYLRQYGVTHDGNDVIEPNEASKLLINFLGIPNSFLKDMLSGNEIDLTYGQDYVFADMARIMANPYIAIDIPDPTNLSRNYTGDTKDHSDRAWERFGGYLHTIWKNLW
jgi:hypothetical protein